MAIFGVASWANKIGNYELALELLPNKTSANRQKLSKIQNLEEANLLATHVLEQNSYVTMAYKVKASYAYNHKQWEKMIENQKQAIRLKHYDIKEYEELVFMISQALEQTVRQKQEKETQYLLEEVKKVNSLLEQTKKNTNPLAYQTVDKPELELSEEIKKYLESLEYYET